MSERAKPVVAWMYKADFGYAVHRERAEGATIPVVVTPLLPDDPRPGETWVSSSGEIVVTSAPFQWRHGRAVSCSDGYCRYISELRRKPALKTFALRGYVRTHHNPLMDRVPARIQAESREAALAKLADALDEVEP